MHRSQRLHPLRKCPDLTCRRSRRCHAQTRRTDCLREFMTAEERHEEIECGIEAILAARRKGAARPMTYWDIERSRTDFMKAVDDAIAQRIRDAARAASP